MIKDKLFEQENLVEFVGTMMPQLDEKRRRIFLGALSELLGRGGITSLSTLTGVSRVTITAAKQEIKKLVKDPKARPLSADTVRIRSVGGGRKSSAELNSELESELLSLLDGNTVGDPENPLCWTTKSLRNLSQALSLKGICVSHVTVGKILEQLGFSLQQNKKYVEAGDPGPDRDEQFNFINDLSKEFMAAGEPVISVDTKKKELVGNYKNNGCEYKPKGEPTQVEDHDFGKLKASPYGIYDIGANEGFVNVGISADTGAFAVNSIRSWWNEMGKERYPFAKRLMITADGGGSNGRRCRLWKVSLQEFANETGLEIHVSHFPPGTSKWNKIEHRLFSYISKNWRGRPLETLEVIVSLIAGTTTKSGLKVQCKLDESEYMKGIKIADDQMAALNHQKKEWHGEWNYIISPSQQETNCKV